MIDAGRPRTADSVLVRAQGSSEVPRLEDGIAQNRAALDCGALDQGGASCSRSSYRERGRPRAFADSASSCGCPGRDCCAARGADRAQVLAALEVGWGGAAAWERCASSPRRQRAVGGLTSRRAEAAEVPWRAMRSRAERRKRARDRRARGGATPWR